MNFFALLKSATGKKLVERRKYPRIDNALRISYQIGSNPLCSECRSKDISEGGIRIGLYQKLNVASTLKLSIHFPGVTDPVVVFGKIAWTQETPGRDYPYEAGIAFDLFDSSLRTMIKTHLQTIGKDGT